MILGADLQRLLQAQHAIAEDWLNQVFSPQFSRYVARQAANDWLIGACEGKAPTNGSYVYHFELIRQWLGAWAPDQAYALGVRWRRTVPLPPVQHAQDLTDAYCLLHGTRILLHSSHEDIFTFARYAFYAELPALEVDGEADRPEWPLVLVETLQALERMVRGFGRRELMRNDHAASLQAVLWSRHYHWVDAQRQIRKETARGTRQQDHDSRDPLVQEAERPSADHRPVG